MYTLGKNKGKYMYMRGQGTGVRVLRSRIMIHENFETLEIKLRWVLTSLVECSYCKTARALKQST